jgi:DNA-binding transcriptional ArsR family regulator
LPRHGQSAADINPLLLAEHERTVSEISEAIGASLQSTSHHLRILGFNNMVKTRRGHHNILYYLIDNEMVKNCPVVAKSPKIELTETHLIQL